MSREALVKQRVKEILFGRGVVSPGPSYYSGSGVVTPGPVDYSGSGVVMPGPSYYSGSGVVTPGPVDYSGSGVVTPGPARYSGSGKRRKVCPHCHGSGFWDDVWSGIKTAGNIASTVAPFAMAALPLLGLGKGKGKGKKRPSKRNLMIKRLMQEHGMTLPEASKFLKEQGL